MAADVAPGAPTSVLATPGDAQATFSWSPPASDGGSPITGYRVEYKLSSESWGASAPNAPVLSATAQSGQVTLDWDPPFDGGSPITDYVGQFRLYNGTFSDDNAPTSTSTLRVISPLTNGQQYEFRIAAVNAQGQSGWSNIVSATPPLPSGASSAGLWLLADIYIENGNEVDAENVAAVIGARRSSGEPVVMMGDIVYDFHDSSTLRNNFESNFLDVAGVSRTNRDDTIPALGNHDTYYAESDYATWRSWWGGLSEVYYTHIVGNVRVIVLDTNEGGGYPDLSAAQLSWLDSQLAIPHTGLTVLAHHHYLRSQYTREFYGYIAPMEGIYQRAYNAGVDLIVTGHFHSFEATKKINNSWNPDPNGFRQIIAGMGGNSHVGTNEMDDSQMLAPNGSGSVVEHRITGDDYPAQGVVHLTTTSTTYSLRYYDQDPSREGIGRAPRWELLNQAMNNPDNTNVPTTVIPVYDTCWELFQAPGSTLADVDEYFAYLANKGFAGVWASVLPIGYQNGGESQNSALQVTDSAGNVCGQMSGSDFQLTTGHANHIKAYLDKAQQYGLQLNPVLAWASNNVQDTGSGCSWNTGNPAHLPVIDQNNAYAYGQNIASHFGTHPAIGYWVLGGDDINSCDSSTLWANMRNGLRTGDNDQPTTYHTGGDYNRFKNESWNEFLSPQTGWGGQTFNGALGDLVSEFSGSKEVCASEMRYYLDVGYTASEVAAETQRALDDGVHSMVYGDMRRVFPGMHNTLYYSMPVVSHIRDTFDSPGEDAFFGVVGN